MSAYQIAWIVVGAAAVFGLAGLIMLTRSLPAGLPRAILRWLPPLLLVVPAAVPGHDGAYAPAFVVATFEWLFQTDGRPLGALRVLLVTAALGLLALLGAHRLLAVRVAKRGG